MKNEIISIMPIYHNGDFIKFYGNNEMEGELHKNVYDEYSIRFLFRQSGDDLTKSRDSNVFPPMPFLFNNFSLYRIGQRKMKFYHKDFADIDFELSAYGDFELVIKSKKKSNITAVYINNVLLCSKKFFTSLKGKYLIGNGHKKRYWKGNIGYLRVTRFNESRARETILNITP